ncbi:MAG: aldo/keto reductase [Deltaproteobacteria bacterium]|nr:aldo/keto reductase [Deltaproteobacteria bacterium]
MHQLHAVDPEVPIEDSVGEFTRLQEEGKIKHIGLSNVDANQIEEALKTASIESVQNRFNPLCQRDIDNQVLETCLKHKITYLTYSPVGGGQGHQALGEHPTLLEIAQKHGVSSYQAMLAFALSQGPHVIAIPGASKISSITDSVKALDVKLDPDDIKKIREIEMVA